MATEWSNLIPESVARDVIDAAVGTSRPCSSSATSFVMPSGVTHVPVVTVAPSAQFVGVGARKPVTTVEWTAERLEPEEIAAIAVVPDQFIDDAGFPVWQSVQARSRRDREDVDAAVIFGTNAPATYPTGGIAALAGAAEPAPTRWKRSTRRQARRGDRARPERDHAGSPIGSALGRRTRDDGAALGGAGGEHLRDARCRTPAWDPTKGDALVGDWSKLLVGIREDISFDLSSDRRRSPTVRATSSFRRSSRT